MASESETACSECHGQPATYGSIHGERCAYNDGFPTCGAHLCSICDRDRIMGATALRHECDYETVWDDEFGQVTVCRERCGNT